ncbi:hypothetical protein ACIQKE_03785 [Streptomyces griseoviridis]|uniref:hypothetical protein n=1 Tax=Streptomyces TaxID=1883 RepID=UPI0024743C10|nr:hypothetical protein [Streptomyces sp. MAA16]MDH6696479.1 hypothetical protein [Streptomyces sp. MAA16]
MLSRKLLTFAATFVTSLGVGGTQTASALDHAEAPTGPSHATRLTATEAAANVLPPSIQGLHAVLWDAETNEPLRGRQIVFTNTGGRELCRAVTDPLGEAACSAPLALSLSTPDTLVNGYTASYSGDRDHLPATAHGTINIDVDCMSTPPPSDRALKDDVVMVVWTR